MLILHKPKCENIDITTIITSKESHLSWKKHFHKNPLLFRIYADFKADNQKDTSSVGNKTTNFYKQTPVLNGYHIVSELEDALESNYLISSLGYINVDWFVDEVMISENKIVFFFKNTKKDIIMTEEDEGDFKKYIFVVFVEKKY